jgi:hypothetical protein
VDKNQWKYFVDDDTPAIRLTSNPPQDVTCGVSNPAGWHGHRVATGENIPEMMSEQSETGARKWIRTTDLLITNQLLCQLSYAGFATKP